MVRLGFEIEGQVLHRVEIFAETVPGSCRQLGMQLFSRIVMGQAKRSPVLPPTIRERGILPPGEFLRQTPKKLSDSVGEQPPASTSALEARRVETWIKPKPSWSAPNVRIALDELAVMIFENLEVATQQKDFVLELEAVSKAKGWRFEGGHLLA